MFRYIFTYEFSQWWRSPAFYIYWLLFAGMAFIGFAGTAGLFDPPPASLQKSIAVLNSPFAVNSMLQYFGRFLIFLLPAIIGATVYKDFRNNAHSLLYSFPIRRTDYLLGKFCSAFLIVAIIAVSVPAAIALAEQLPGLHPQKLGPFNISGYLYGIGVIILPNMLIYGMIVFAVVVKFRNIYAGFMTALLIFFARIILQNAFAGNDYLIALFDPLGENAMAYLTRYWTLNEQNTLSMPVDKVLVLNRILWLAASAIIFGVVFMRFRFTEFAPAFLKIKNRWSKRKIASDVIEQRSETSIVKYDHTWRHQLRSLWALSLFNIKYLLYNWMSVAMMGAGSLAMIFILGKVTVQDDMSLLPVTHIMLMVPSLFFTTMIMLLTFIYAGMLVHRDRNAQIEQLVDSTAASTVVLMFSKVLAILKVQIVWLVVMMLSAMAIQAYHGYYRFEIGQYLFDLFAIKFLWLAIWAFIAVFMHTLVTNQYLAIFGLILIWMSPTALEQIGINSRLLQINFQEPLSYSDLTGYGYALKHYFSVQFYWLAGALFILICSKLLWRRGLPGTLLQRLSLARTRIEGVTGITLLILLGVVITLGYHIAKHEAQITPEPKNAQRVLNVFKKKFKKYATIHQPKVTAIDLHVALYPGTNDFTAEGRYTLVNQSSQSIDTILIKTGFDEITETQIRSNARIIAHDSVFKFSVYKLDEPLHPGDSMPLHFKIRNIPNIVFQRNSNVLRNGTFIKHDMLPRIQYAFGDDPKPPEDTTAALHHYHADDSDLIDITTTVSTSDDQIAFAPGYLAREWQENGRRFFQYKMGKPMKFSLGINSGKFATRKTTHRDVKLEIYHHPDHTYNLDRMFYGLKSAIDYNTKYFSPYQHREARIIEFPLTEGTYATTFANSIPTSEMRFIANTDTTGDKIDIAFYVAAHEITHQWWGNQITPASALGAHMLAESITEYVTLKCYEHAYGKAKALNFLKKQRERYLRGRTGERKQERPLSHVHPNQSYIAYGKGAMAFNTLSHYVGEDELNRILKDFLEEYQFSGAPYPTTLDLLQKFKDEIPEEYRYLIADYFETVTLHEAEVISGVYTALNDTFEIELKMNYKKLTDKKEAVDGTGDLIEVGVYDADSRLLKTEAVRISEGQSTITLYVPKRPFSITIDPNVLLIEKDIRNNFLTLVTN